VFIRIEIYIIRTKRFIMDTKLTLSLKKKTIDKAKQYAKNHQTSVSQLVEKYFESIVTQERMELSELGEITRKLMSGPAFGGSLSAKELIRDARAEKYL